MGYLGKLNALRTTVSGLAPLTDPGTPAGRIDLIMKDGACLGAVGVSGVKSTEDAQIARAGIAALGL